MGDVIGAGVVIGTGVVSPIGVIGPVGVVRPVVVVSPVTLVIVSGTGVDCAKVKVCGTTMGVGGMALTSVTPAMLSPVNCVATGSVLNAGPLNVKPITDIGRSELTMRRPVSGPPNSA